MKFLILTLLFWGCTQKYVDYDLIRKVDFNKASYERPMTLMEILPQGKDQLDACFNQWLFFSNAEKEKERSIPLMVKTLCPGKDYLVSSHMVESWWTLIVFSRACVDIETLCGEPKKKQ